MSLSNLRSYFKSNMNALSYREHKDAFNFDNIASTRIDRGYHLEAGPVVQVSQNQHDVVLSASVSIRVFLKGYRYPGDALDDAYTKAESIIKRFLKASNRVGSTVKNIELGTCNFEPFSGDNVNDNIVVIELSFDTLLIVDSES